MISPREILRPYQDAYDKDRSRFKAWVASRQIGKSVAATHECVEDCYLADLDGKKTDWVMISSGERQALELLDKAKAWTEAYQIAIEDYTEDRPEGSETLLRSATITWPNGSRIIALPANPATARGYSANLVLDEFAFHENPDAIWRAVFPLITNPSRGALKLRVVSTPNGQGNKFHEICTNNPRFSVHKTTIHEAKAQGYDVDIDELREVFGDPEAWAQEFECEFIDLFSILLAYELIALNESHEASEFCPPGYWESSHQFPIDMGIDYGRKHDLSVAWSAEAVMDLQITKEVLTMDNMSTPDQVELLRPRIRSCRRVCLDYTGMGTGLGDYLVKEFGEWKPQEDKFGKVELCTLSQPFNQEVFSNLKMAFDKRNWRIPVSKVIREDLHAIYRIATKNGVSYRAPHRKDGHSDRAYAIALCNRARGFGGMGCITDARSIRTGGNGQSRSRFKPRRLVQNVFANR